MENLAQAEVDRELYSKEMEEDDLGMRLLSTTVASIHHHQYQYRHALAPLPHHPHPVKQYSYQSGCSYNQG